MRIGEDLELIGHAHIVAVRGDAVGDDTLPRLVLGERLDHAGFERHLTDPMIRFEAHGWFL